MCALHLLPFVATKPLYFVGELSSGQNLNIRILYTLHCIYSYHISHFMAPPSSVHVAQGVLKSQSQDI